MLEFILGLISMLLVNTEAADSKNDAQIFALTRDGNYRADPDQLLNGFFAAWPVVLLVLAGVFFILAIVAFLGYATGLCRGRNQQRYESTINQNY